MFESLSSGCLEYFLFEPDSCVILMGELHFARMQWTYRWINRIFTVKYQVDFSRRMVVSTFLFLPVSQFVMHWQKEFSYTRLSISFCVCVCFPAVSFANYIQFHVIFLCTIYRSKLAVFLFARALSLYSSFTLGSVDAATIKLMYN